MALDAGLHYLTRGYIERTEPEYFVDDESSGVTWQPDVYPELLALAREHGRDVVIDLGCGRAGKLAGLAVQEPGLQVVGVDIGPNIAWCRENHQRGSWLEADLESATTLPLTPATIERSVVVCSGRKQDLAPRGRHVRRLPDQLDRLLATITRSNRLKRSVTIALDPATKDDEMTRLSESVDQATALLASADLGADAHVRELLALTHQRRSMDLSDLSPTEQAALIAERSQQLQPSTGALAARITDASAKGRPFIAKFGIDPTGAEVHLGHAVPMLVLSRFQRMGHQVVFIVGDVTAKIGDPSGRSDERPALTDADIACNLATYQQQVTPFFDFTRAQFRYNGDWLREVKLPELIEITAQIPVSMPLQREDFRQRLEAGKGLSLAELLYSVVMALDSVEINSDLEVGGIDQFLNMQMCRKVMEICGQTPELVVATSLIEGTDGTGAKMSKSKGNYVPVAAAPGEIFGKLMSVPDRLVSPYFRALSEWRDPELAIAEQRLNERSLHPMDLKKILAGEVTAAVHGVDAAMTARDEFTARFSKRTFAEVETLPTISDLGQPIVETIKALGFAKSNKEISRIAQQHGLRVVVETDTGQEQVNLTPDEAREALATVLKDKIDGVTRDHHLYLKVGRKLARIATT